MRELDSKEELSLQLRTMNMDLTSDERRTTQVNNILSSNEK